MLNIRWEKGIHLFIVLIIKLRNTRMPENISKKLVMISLVNKNIFFFFKEIKL